MAYVDIENLPQQLCVEITQDDISHAGGDEYTCPIALAITRQLGLEPDGEMVEVCAPGRDGRITIGDWGWSAVAIYRHNLQSAALVRLWDDGDDTRQFIKPVKICLERVA